MTIRPNPPIGSDMRNGLLALVVLSIAGWGLVLWSAANMSSPVVNLMMPMTSDWAVKEVIAVWLMWAVMMGAMMLPSAIPMLLVHRRIASCRRDPETRHANRWFLAAYLLTWTMFEPRGDGALSGTSSAQTSCRIC